MPLEDLWAPRPSLRVARVDVPHWARLGPAARLEHAARPVPVHAAQRGLVRVLHVLQRLGDAGVVAFPRGRGRAERRRDGSVVPGWLLVRACLVGEVGEEPGRAGPPARHERLGDPLAGLLALLPLKHPGGHVLLRHVVRLRPEGCPGLPRRGDEVPQSLPPLRLLLIAPFPLGHVDVLRDLPDAAILVPRPRALLRRIRGKEGPLRHVLLPLLRPLSPLQCPRVHIHIVLRQPLERLVQESVGVVPRGHVAHAHETLALMPREGVRILIRHKRCPHIHRWHGHE
mmetsp:Transcript_68385/g.216404  ORF Transcript_68385/g.216404 Transcript_68385/m.216404 type:complete len:285 (-) Transcript_68385:194-1048(-)